MRNSKEGILVGAPFLKRLGNPSYLVLGGKVLVDRRLQKARLQDPAGPARRKLTHPLTRIPPMVPRRLDLVPGKPGLARPHMHIPASVGLAAIRPRDRLVKLRPAPQLRGLRIPRKGLVVGLAGSDNATATLDHPPHLAQDAHGIRDVLQHLVARDDVERLVGIRQLVRVNRLKRHVRQPPGRRVRPCLLQHRRHGVAADHFPLWYELRQIRRDGPRSASDIEDLVAGLDVGDEKRRRVLRGASCVVLDDSSTMWISLIRGVLGRI